MPVHKISSIFFNNFQVEWPCPACKQKTLQILKKTFVSQDSKETRTSWREEWFDPEMSKSVFICLAECTRSQCKEVVACSGEGGMGRYGEEGHNDIEIWFRPRSFVPALHPIEISENCPKEIAAPLTTSFSVYLIQPGAAANLIRISVERMLTAMGVPERDKNDNRIYLHARLKTIPKIYTSFSENLMAIKFLGNAGSHTHDIVKISDIEDAFEIMDYIINDLFSGRKESIELLTKRLHDQFRDQ